MNLFLVIIFLKCSFLKWLNSPTYPLNLNTKSDFQLSAGLELRQKYLGKLVLVISGWFESPVIAWEETPSYTFMLIISWGFCLFLQMLAPTLRQFSMLVIVKNQGGEQY